MRSSATQFRVRQVSSAQLRARRRRERVNPLTLGAARENSSKRLIHFHETADENTSLGCSMRLPTAAAYVRTRVHALTKGLKEFTAISTIDFECRGESLQFAGQNFDWSYRTFQTCMRHSLTPPTRKSEGRGKRLSRKHQGEIYVTGLLRKCWSPRKLIVRWKVAVEMKRCGSSSLFIFLCRARPQEKFTSNNNLQDKFRWDNVLRYIWRIMSFNWWYVALDSMVDRLKEFETAQL